MVFLINAQKKYNLMAKKIYINTLLKIIIILIFIIQIIIKFFYNSSINNCYNLINNSW